MRLMIGQLYNCCLTSIFGLNLPVIDRGCIFYPFDTGVGFFGLRNGQEKECSEEQQEASEVYVGSN